MTPEDNTRITRTVAVARVKKVITVYDNGLFCEPGHMFNPIHSDADFWAAVDWLIGKQDEEDEDFLFTLQYARFDRKWWAAIETNEKTYSADAETRLEAGCLALAQYLEDK